MVADTLSKAVSWLVAKVARTANGKAWLDGLTANYRSTQLQAVTAASVEIPEVTPINVRFDDTTRSTRINLLVPALSARHLFGGIETALQIFERLLPYFDQARIIVTDEAIPVPKREAYYGQWPLVSLSDAPPDSSHIVAAGSRWNQTLQVHEQDYFMATAWWTAHNAYLILSQQQQHFKAATSHRLIYLIQDYEPGFYPWSTRFALAQATYSASHRVVAIINSTELADYLKTQGNDFPECQVLYPQLHPQLASIRRGIESFQKQRLVLIYGRPGTDRNAFLLIVAALRNWFATDPDARYWRVLSAGEAFEPVSLGQSCWLESVGKLSMEQYADLLSRSAIGVSMMISPHPSYPPLEMAAFGARVITNQFANKDLSRYSSFITSVPQIDTNSLCEALTRNARLWCGGPDQTMSVDKSAIDWAGSFLNSGTAWDGSADVANAVLGTPPT